MIEASTLTNPWEHIFTYVDDDGANINIHAARLRSWCLEAKGLEIWCVPISKAQARKYLRNNVVSKERVNQLTADHMKEPMIFCKDGTFTDGKPDVFHVDGHHRYVWYAAAGLTFGEAWVLEVEQWKHFQVVGLPAISQRALKEMPHLKREY